MAGFKNFVDGTALPEADLDDYLAKQVVMKFASNAARDAALTAGTGKREGMVTIQDDTNSLTVSTGTGVGNYSTIGPAHGGLTSYTPTVTQSGGVTVTVNSAYYTRLGRWIQGYFILTVTGSGTAANVVTISLPVSAAANQVSDYGTFGYGKLYDVSATSNYPGHIVIASSTTIKFANDTSVATDFLGAAGFTAGLAANDILSGFFNYEAAGDA